MCGRFARYASGDEIAERFRQRYSSATRRRRFSRANSSCCFEANPADEQSSDVTTHSSIGNTSERPAPGTTPLPPRRTRYNPLTPTTSGQKT